MQLDISVRLIPQTTIICHHIKKILLQKIQKYEEIDQNPYANKNDT